MDIDEMAGHYAGCRAVASCPGLILTRKRISKKSRKLITDPVRLLCRAVEQNPTQTVKFVLINTARNRNGDHDYPISMSNGLMTGLLIVLLPPHPDNAQAADFPREHIVQDLPTITSTVVRQTNNTQDTISRYP